MNTRRLIKRIQGPVIWAVAIMFGAGVVWWSVASYLGGRGDGDFTPEHELTLAETVAVLTKDGEQLDDAIFWVSFQEYETAVREALDNIRQQGMSVDPYFGTEQVPGEMEVRYEVVKDLINQRILRYYAQQEGVLPGSAQIDGEAKRIVDELAADANTRSQIIQYYGSIDAFTEVVKRFVTSELLVMNTIDRALGDVDEGFRSYFDENKESLKRDYEKVTASHILVESEEEARELKALIESGEIGFADAAMEYSEDAGSAAQGGDLGSFGRGQMIPEFEEAAFNASIGEIVGPVESYYGYHLIQVSAMSTFDTVEELQEMGLYADLLNDFRQRKFVDWFEDYKVAGGFGYELNDEDLMLYDRYTDAKTDPEKTEELLKELTAMIFHEDDEHTVAILDSYLPTVVFVQLANSRLNRYDSTVYDLEDAIYYYETVPETLRELAKDEIEEQLAVIPEMEDQEEDDMELKYSREDLENALDLKEIEVRLDISSEEDARNMLEMKLTAETQLEDQFKRVVRYLYGDLPFSSTVLEYMYMIERDNPEVVLRYHENSYNKNLSPIISNREMFQMYLQYYEQFLGQQAVTFLLDMPIRNMEEDLLGVVVNDPDVPRDLRVTALYLLIEVYERLANLFPDSAIARVHLLTQKHYLEKLDDIIPGDEGVLQTIEIVNAQIRALEDELDPEEIIEPDEFEAELELDELPTTDELDETDDFELDIGPLGTE